MRADGAVQADRTAPEPLSKLPLHFFFVLRVGVSTPRPRGASEAGDARTRWDAHLQQSAGKNASYSTPSCRCRHTSAQSGMMVVSGFRHWHLNRLKNPGHPNCGSTQEEWPRGQRHASWYKNKETTRCMNIFTQLQTKHGRIGVFLQDQWRKDRLNW